MGKPTYDTTVARMAGNIAAGLLARGTHDGRPGAVAVDSVAMARRIVEETKRTQPIEHEEPPR